MTGNPATSGRRPVEIGGSVYSPFAIPQRIEDNFRTILDKAGRIMFLPRAAPEP